MSKQTKFFQSKELQSKISNTYKIITIGVIGTSFGIGVTHFCLALNTYFGKNRSKVALVERSDTPAFSAIENAYEGKNVSDLTECFNIKKTKFYKDFKGPIGQIKDLDFQVIIIDYGEVSNRKIQEFNETDIRIVIGQGNEWKYLEIEGLNQQFSKDDMKNWKWVLNFGSKAEVSQLNKDYRVKAKTFKYYKDPFLWDKELSKNIASILEG